MAPACFSNAAANPAHLLFLQRKYQPTLSPPPRNRLQSPGFEQNFRDVTACFTCFIRSRSGLANSHRNKSPATADAGIDATTMRLWQPHDESAFTRRCQCQEAPAVSVRPETIRWISLSCSSFPRKRESRIPALRRLPWPPAFVGVTVSFEAANHVSGRTLKPSVAEDRSVGRMQSAGWGGLHRSTAMPIEPINFAVIRYHTPTKAADCIRPTPLSAGRASVDLLEKIAVRTEPDEAKDIRRGLGIDQQEIGPEMAISIA